MKPCPHSYHAIWTVSRELDFREDGLGDSLLSGDSAVLLDFLTEKGLAGLSDVEQMSADLERPHRCLWFHWLVQHTIENTKRDFEPDNRTWLPLSDITSWFEEHVWSDERVQQLLYSRGDSMPNDVFNVAQVILEHVDHVRFTFPTHWRLYPQLQKALK